MASSQPPTPPSVFVSSPAVFTTSLPRHASSFGNLSPSIFIIILILAVTVIASVALCFLLRHLNRRCLRHLAPSSSSSSPSSSSDAAAPAGVGDSQRAISSRRVSPETNPSINSLPLFSFSSVTRRGGTAFAISGADCAVCLSKFEPADQLRLLPICCHAFHALCVDTWLQSNQSCPLCRSPIFVSDADILKTLGAGERNNNHGDSFRIEIGNVSRHRQMTPTSDNNFSGDRSRSYSIGSFEYLVDEDSEVVVTNAHQRSVSDFKELLPSESIQVLPPPPPPPLEAIAAEVSTSGRSWLKEYVDRLSMSFSSRAMSFRSSGRFFSGSSRRSDVVLGAGEWDLEASRVGEEISELFRWVSGV
ncbi:hypothetical protein TIFTF001_031109 [Ficus carica]|uniref:RING-type E3 ubiquitin transferase n=1 Tax=Ficus carica TaxID=3494 RepID=A0AA88DUU0_FICCA|nr:hypothetical protein TIFTF001_031109 [Ficus carica]